ncbi:hypothetical protein PVIIG_02522, partial [Plasmodium vivax India VII]
MEVHTPSAKGEYIEQLLRNFAGKKGKLKRKEVMNQMEHYVGILTNVNLKIVHNKNYEVVHLVLEVLLTNELHLEPMILDKVLACLNLKQILQKDGKVKIKNINNILLLINRKSRNNLNAANLFNLLFDAVALLLEALCAEDIYSVARPVDYTLGGGQRREGEEEEAEEDDEEEEEDTHHTTEEPPSEPLTAPRQTRKRKGANGPPVSAAGGSGESASEPQEGDSSEGAANRAAAPANPAANLANRADSGMPPPKKRKKEGSERLPADEHHNVARINDYVVHVNSLFSLFFKNYKPMLSDVKIYAFYGNLLGLFSYVHDYIGYVEELAERCRSNGGGSSPSSFDSVVKNLTTLKGLIKKQITISLDSITKGYFKSVYASYLGSKEELKVNYSFFNFQENEKLLEVIYIMLHRVSNEKASFRFDPHGEKLTCPSVSLHKSKKDKLICFFKSEHSYDEKHPFLGVSKIRGCLKALATIIKYLLLKQPSANLAHVQTYFTLFLLIPHFELTLYGEHIKGEYSQLFHFAPSRKEKTQRGVNCSVADSDAEAPVEGKPAGESKPTIHRNAANYFKSVKIKIAHSVCRFEKELSLNDHQQTHSNVHIIADYLKVIYKFLKYLNGRSNARKDPFLFVNFTYCLKYTFDCLTNAYFELTRTKLKSALRECSSTGGSSLPPSERCLRERMYLRGKPHLALYDKKMRNIFCTYPRGRAPHLEETTLERDNRSDRGEAPTCLLLPLKRNGRERKKLMGYLVYLIYVSQVNLLTVIHFDVTLRTLIFSALFSFGKALIPHAGSHLAGSVNIGGPSHVDPPHVDSFASRTLRTVMTKYVEIFGVKGLLKFLHYYTVGRADAQQGQSLRSIHFLQNSFVMEVFKASVGKWVDQAPSILGYFIEVYTYHVTKLGQTVEGIIQLREGGGGEDPRNVLLNSCASQKGENSSPHRGHSLASYLSIVQNVETLEYIICCFLKAIPKRDITHGLLTYVKEIASVHMAKLKNEMTFHNKTGEVNFVHTNFAQTNFAHSSSKHYILFFFNYSVCRVAMYALLHGEVKTEQLLGHPAIQHIVAMLQSCFPTVEPMFDLCVREDSLHAFFCILQMVLQTLFFFLSLAELRVV